MSQRSFDSATAQDLIDAEADKFVERLIDEGGIVRPSWWASQRGRFWLFLAALVASGVLTVFYQAWLLRGQHSASLPNGIQLATALIAALAAIFGYYQWIESRREGSLDKFYERLALGDQRLCEWEPARRLVNHFWIASVDEADFQRTMYVYIELDNLEYIISRYQLGFVSKHLLRRAVRTFRSRCESAAFVELATTLVQGAGYYQNTAQVVLLIAASVRGQRA